jgi:hypothetical protein
LAKFCNELLKISEAGSLNLQHLGCIESGLAVTAVTNTLRSMTSGSKEAISMFPRLLQLIEYEGVSRTFLKEVSAERVLKNRINMHK